MPAAILEPELISLDEIAEDLGLNYMTLYARCRRGSDGTPPVYPYRRRLVMRRDDYAAWKASPERFTAGA